MSVSAREGQRRQVIELHVKGKTPTEISRALGLPRTTVRDWLASSHCGQAERLADAPAAVQDSPIVQSMMDEAARIEIADLQRRLKTAEDNSTTRGNGRGINRAPVTPAYDPGDPLVKAAEYWSLAEKRNAERIERADTENYFDATFPGDEPIGISFASDQHVSFDNTVALERMREDAQIIARTPGLYAVLGGDAIDNHCLDENTELLTSRGWVRWNAIEQNDKVVGLTEGHKAVWQGINNIVVAAFSGDMVQMRTESVDMLVTPGHRVLCKHGDYSANYNSLPLQYDQADSIQGGRRWIPVAADQGLPDSSVATDDELRLVGWLLTDGWIAKRSGEMMEYCIAQRESNAGQLRDLLTRLGYRFTTYRRTPNPQDSNLKIKTAEPLITYRISAVHRPRLSVLLPSKERLPSWVYSLSRRQFTVFLDAVIEGDGSYNGRARILYGKINFLEEVQVACVIHGYAAKITCVRGRSEQRLLIVDKPAEQVLANKRVCSVQYNGTVWCLQTDTGNFLARRNGKPFFTGNCKIRSAMLAARSQPSDQYRLFEVYLNWLSEKLIVMINGNHDAWGIELAGVDMLKRIADAHKVCYAPAEAFIRMKVGGQNYLAAVRHQYIMNSTLNQCHAVKQWYRFGQELFDVGCICHHHEAAIESFTGHGKKRWACRPGSYQIMSSYSRQYGFPRATPTCPTFIFLPNRREIYGFDDVYQAARFLIYERAWYAGKLPTAIDDGGVLDLLKARAA